MRTIIFMLMFVATFVQAQIKPPQIVLPPQGGAPMELRELNATARIAGLHAEVTTTLVFHNPNPRALEGELEFPLPDGAAVTGYALDIHGQMVDGVVVKKEQARVAFETEVRQGVDPGIVEHTAGNVYRTRIFPLPSNGDRTIRLRYITPLPVDAQGDAAWHLPMPRGQAIPKVSIRVEVDRGEVTPKIGGFGNLQFQSFEKEWVASTELRDVKPGDDLWVSLPKLPKTVKAVEHAPDGEYYFTVSEMPPTRLPSTVAAPPRLAGILWDASASRSGDHIEKEFAALRELFRWWPGTHITLLVFRDRVEAPQTFTNVDALIEVLKKTPFDGGTDLSKLGEAMTVNKADRWILFTDGMDTMAGPLPDFGSNRVTTIVSQPIAQRELLRQACAVSGGAVVDLQRLSTREMAEQVVQPAPRLMGVSGTGISEVQGIGADAAGRITIHGKLTSDTADITLEYSDGQKSKPVKLEKSKAHEGTLLAAAWAAKRIDQLAVRAEANEEELLSLGRRYGLASPATSLIVLESVDQYVRNDIEPPASQPQWHEQWLARKAAQSKADSNWKSSKIDRVLAMWNDRTCWWENTNIPVKSLDKDIPHPVANGVVAESRSSVRTLHGESSSVPQNRPAQSAVTVAETPAVMAAPASASAPEVQGNTGAIAVSRRIASDGAANNLTEDQQAAKSKAGSSDGDDTKAITVQAWNPSTPYLAIIKGAAKADRYRVYLEQRKGYERSPAFFVDCADLFFTDHDDELGARILSNLAEMRLDDAGVLRVMAWRFQQASDFDHAIQLLRKTAKLRPEEPQSSRDLALALSERGKSHKDVADLREAVQLFEKVVLGNWQRFEEIEVTALEEMNALLAWAKTAPLSIDKPLASSLDSRLLVNHDVDVRIVMSWDADNTDVDLHVIEPSGEEAFYGHNRTSANGLVSRDFTQGYGPEEYMIRRATPGAYKIFAHYFGSHQQTVIGPCTITATIFTDFGRPTEKKQTMTLRVDQPRDRADMGQITISSKSETHSPTPVPLERDAFRTVRPGQSTNDVVQLLGSPQQVDGRFWTYKTGERQYRVQFSDQNTVKTVYEVLPGGVTLILAQ